MAAAVIGLIHGILSWQENSVPLSPTEWPWIGALVHNDR